MAKESKEVSKQKDLCVLCMGPESEVGPLARRKDGHGVCYMCAKIATDVFAKDPISRRAAEKLWEAMSEKGIRREEIPIPKDIFAHLSQHVIGQDHAKEVLAIACCEHLKSIYARKYHHPFPMKKKNVLMIGGTGVGKTELARSLADYLQVPFAIGDATTLTDAGYVGEDVENLLLKLIHAADFDMAAAQTGIIYIDEIDKLGKRTQNVSTTRDVGGEGVQQCLLKLMEGTMANVPSHAGRKHPEAQYIPMDTTNVLFICGGTFDGGGGSGRLEEIIRRRLGGRSIGFHQSQGFKEVELERDELRSLVTPDDLMEFGMIPEFVGRVPIVAPLHSLSVEHLVRILTEPVHSLVKQTCHSFRISEVGLEFEDEALWALAEQAHELHTGARGLDSVVAKLMHKPHFEIDQYKGKVIKITKAIVAGEEEITPEENKQAA